MKNLLITMRLFLSLLVLNSLASASHYDELERRRYCTHHRHYADCPKHKFTKNCEFESYNDTIKRTNQYYEIDYSNSSISDTSVKNPSVRHLNEILQKLGKKIDRIEECYPNNPISIVMADNYLKDEGIRELYEFIMKNQHLKEKLRKIDLRNNRISKDSLPTIKELLTNLPILKVDLSLNSLTREDFKSIFSDSSTHKRIIFEAY